MKKWLKWGRLKDKVRVLNRTIIHASIVIGEKFVPTTEVMTVYDVFLLKQVVDKPRPVFLGIESDGTLVYPVFVCLLKAEPPQKYVKMRIPNEKTAVLALTDEEYEFYEKELDSLKEALMRVLAKSGHPRAWMLRRQLDAWWRMIHR